MSKFQNDAIFWVDVDKIDPNPYQPRRDFNEEGLRDLAESIRQYGVLQPLTVTRNEKTKEDGGLKVYYELIAGERRLKAAKLANLSQVPVTIRDEKEDAEVKLELAIIENLQREDLNPIERAEAFNQLSDEFDFTHKEIAEKIGKSREYVSNSMRLLKLPEDVKQAVMSGKISEGHTRPILMLRDKPDKQEQLFKEIIHKDLTVRESEKIARREAQDKVRKKKNKVDPETKALEDELSDTFGTRVKIEQKDDEGGKLVIDFFSQEDLEAIVEMVKSNEGAEMEDMMEKYINSTKDDEDSSKDEQDDSAADDGVADESEEGKKALSETPDSTQEETHEDQPQETVSANGQVDTEENKKEDEPSQKDNIAETLGTLIQQAKKERAQENKSSNSTSDHMHTQEQTASTQTEIEDTGDTSSLSNSSSKQSLKKSTQEDKVASNLPPQSSPNTQTNTNNKQTDKSLTSDSQKSKGHVSGQAGGNGEGSNSANSTQTEGDSSEKKSKNHSDSPKQSVSADEVTSQPSPDNEANTMQTKKDDQRSKKGVANEPQSDGGTGKDYHTDTDTEVGQDKTDNRDKSSKKELRNKNVSDHDGQEDSNDQNDMEDSDDQDDMYSVSNFSI